MKSVYYSTSWNVPMASQISCRVRREMFDIFMWTFYPGPDYKILDVGCTSDDSQKESNFFEELYPYKDRITCVGTEDIRHLETKYPGVRTIQIEPGGKLPFKDNEFDIVFSNAVLEHVGSSRDQQLFIDELIRVSRHFFITTPYRYFPIEHHTGIPFLHWLPWCLYRKITPYAYWRDEKNLHLLSRRDFRALFSPVWSPRIQFVKVFGVPSNMVAYR